MTFLDTIIFHEEQIHQISSRWIIYLINLILPNSRLTSVELSLPINEASTIKCNAAGLLWSESTCAELLIQRTNYIVGFLHSAYQDSFQKVFGGNSNQLYLETVTLPMPLVFLDVLPGPVSCVYLCPNAWFPLAWTCNHLQSGLSLIFEFSCYQFCSKTLLFPPQTIAIPVEKLKFLSIVFKKKKIHVLP